MALLGILLLLLGNVVAKDPEPINVTLYDTALVAGELDWITFSGENHTTMGPARGWSEASTVDSQGDPQRVLTVCDIAQQDVHNWVRTPYIPVGEAEKRLYVEMTFTIRKCIKYPEPETLQQCKESFKLSYYEAESDFANKHRPTWDTHTWRHIDVIAADETSVDSVDLVENIEVRSAAIKRRGVYFTFYDEGACMTLTRIKIYYIMCPSVTVNYAIFPNTTTSSDRAAIVQTEGTCVPHAAIEQTPSHLCMADGTWTFNRGGCVCMPGFEPEDMTQECRRCARGHYKWRTQKEPCKPCPAHSQAPSPGAVECRCVRGYYRHSTDDRSHPCTRPPSAVRGLAVARREQSAVTVTWQEPAELGGRRDLSYSVECRRCQGRDVRFHPAQAGFNSTRLRVEGLQPDTEYQIVVHALNGVSDQAELGAAREGRDVVFSTEPAVPSKVSNVRITSVGLDYISVAWERPAAPHTAISTYRVRYAARGANATEADTARRNITLSGLRPKTEYSFQIRGKTKKGWGEYSTPVTATTGHMVLPGSAEGINHISPAAESPVGIITGSAVAVVVCMLIVIIMVIIFFRSRLKYKQYRNHRSCNEKNVSDCDTLQYSNGKLQCSHILDGSTMMNGTATIPLFAPPGGVRTYIDPHTYEDPNQAVREFTKEIDAAAITIESVIGGGEFGDVCKGKLRLAGRQDLTVAIKTLKGGASDKNRLDFLTEASIMGQFDDPNVIYLEGVVTKSNPIMIVTEYMENGSLDTFLRNNDGKFTVIQLVGMMRGISSGMRYLSEMGYVHRDLAARNILVNETLVCKVADFGLSREIESDDTDGAYTTKGGKIPVRWTAPEAIAYRKFTSASDVWSYGVVMWEVMSYGERPYWNWSNQDVIKAVDKGFRLPPPMDCPEAIYQLLLDAWQKERAHRPKFLAIVKTLDKLIRSPELLRKIAKQRPHQYIDPNHPDLTRYDATVPEWLASIKMERYVAAFAEAGVSTMDQAAQLSLQDLKSPPLNITLVGHQKKIMNSIQTLRAHIGGGAQVSEGFMV